MGTTPGVPWGELGPAIGRSHCRYLIPFPGCTLARTQLCEPPNLAPCAPHAASKRMRPSTPSNSALRAMANLGSAPAPLPATPAPPAAAGGAAGGATPGSAGARGQGAGAMTPAAASILSTLESMEKVGARAARHSCCALLCL